ncbi:MAG: energy transducer TonB [Candidatus Zixiibacteriota bacterium]
MRVKALVLIMLFVPLMVTAQTEGKYPSPDEFIKVDSMPQMIENVPPIYPAAEKEARVEGIVVIKALVGKDGSVVKAMVAQSSHNDALDKSAVEAALKNKFKPAKLENKPVAVWVSYKVVFDLGDITDEKS